MFSFTNASVRRRLALATAVVVAMPLALTACGDDTDPAAGPGMMQGEAATSPEGVDAAFVRQMIPHHELAVEMADVALEQAEHAEVRALAREIKASQSKEIAEMRRIARDQGTETSDATGMMGDDAGMMGLASGAMGMSMRASDLDGADPFDREFIDMMIPHHEGAIAMAKAEVARGSSAELEALARGIITAQEREIAEMRQWRKDWYGSSDTGTGDMSGHMDDMHN